MKTRCPECHNKNNKLILKDFDKIQGVDLGVWGNEVDIYECGYCGLSFPVKVHGIKERLKDVLKDILNL